MRRGEPAGGGGIDQHEGVGYNGRTLDGIVELPVTNPTSVAFGDGPNGFSAEPSLATSSSGTPSSAGLRAR